MIVGFDIGKLDVLLCVNVFVCVVILSVVLQWLLVEGCGVIINVGLGILFMQLLGNVVYVFFKNFIMVFICYMQVEVVDSGVQIQFFVLGIVVIDFYEVVGVDFVYYLLQFVMQVDDLVVVLLKVFDMGEVICILFLFDVC